MLFLPLIVIAGLLTLAALEVTEPSDISQNPDINYLLDCGYIHSNISATIFNPNFVLYLTRQQQKYESLDQNLVRNAVAIWNADITDERKKVHYQHNHFMKMTALSMTDGNCNELDNCIVNKEDFAVLRYWMLDVAAETIETESSHPVSLSGLSKLNIDNDKDIGKALELISEDPVGARLISYAISQNITIRSEKIRHIKGYFECEDRTIIIDPTVASYIFKLNCIIHELVHAANPSDDNSIIEETLAEIIGMAVQDRVTDIDISCHPYVVFIDRLLDPHYGKLPVYNNIEEYLQNAGIVIRPELQNQ